MYKACLVLLASVVHGRAVGRAAQQVTPVEQVTGLLQDLQAKLEAEGKAEAIQYDKYACFCKEQADSKLYAIETSAEKIKRLAAKSDELSSEAADLTADASALGASIRAAEEQLQNLTASRTQEHGNYQKEEEDMADAIKALEGAIAALKDSKEAMANAKLNFAQVRRLVLPVLRSAAAVARPLQLKGLLAMTQQAPAAYEYHANDIIATLESLLKTFTENKKELDADEFTAQAAFDKQELDLENQKKFQAKEKLEKDQAAEARTEELHATEAEKAEETHAKEADEVFLAVVQQDCEEKANLWDQRSQVRAGELTAIAEALRLLNTGVATTYGANEKLVGLQTDTGRTVAAAPQAPAKAAALPTRRSLSFLQVRRDANSKALATALAQKAASVLQSASVQLRSQVLATVAARLTASEDHFAKVRSIIKDLISRLLADKEAESSQKSFCDSAMSSSIASRDQAQAQIEQLEARKSSLEAEKASLGEQIAELSKAIAALNKALLEATELRSKEAMENQETIRTATEGKAAVEMALKVLGAFYSKAGGQLIQTRYVPPNSDREGKTLQDLAPEVFQDTYRGAQQSSTGILGLLEVILSDFTRTVDTVTAEETKAQQEFAAFQAKAEADSKAKAEESAAASRRLTEAENELVGTVDSLTEQQGLKAAAEAALQDLKAQCVDGEETYEERVARRNKEIEALKQAKVILEEWQG